MWGNYFVSVAAQALGRAVSLAAGFAAFVIIARVLGTQTLGRVAFITSFVTVGAILANLGTSAALTRGLAEAKAGDPQGYYGNFLLARAVLGTGALAIALPIAGIVRPDLVHGLVAGCFAIPLVAARFYDTVFQIFDRVRYGVFAALVLGAAQLCVALVIVVWLDGGLIGYVYGFVAAQLLYCVTATALSLRLVVPRFRPDREVLGSIARLAAPIGVSSVFMVINSRADVFMLSYMRSDHDVGIYNVAYRILEIGVIAIGTAAAPLVPVLTRSMAREPARAADACRRIQEYLALALLPFPIVAPHVAEPLMTLIYGASYAGSAAVLPVFAWSFLLTAYVMVGASINLAAGNISYGYWYAAIAAALNVVLNWFLIPPLGAVGAALATLATTAFMVLVTQRYVRVNVGSLGVASRWLRIIMCAAVLHLSLLWTAGGPIAVALVGSLVLYVAATAVTGVFPSELARAVRSRIARR